MFLCATQVFESDGRPVQARTADLYRVNSDDDTDCD